MKFSLIFVLVVGCLSQGDKVSWKRDKALHQPRNLSNSRLQRAANLVVETEFRKILKPILVPRVAGTPENAAVRKHITDRLEKLPGWHIESHSFTDHAPYPFGETNFTNIIATHNINAPRRLVLACHHDSKYMVDASRRDFIGATDSAVPCAMLIHLAENLHTYIESRSKDFPELTIQLIFFDGEEAFVRWTSFDSIYGSRKLAERMSSTKHHAAPAGSELKELDAIDVFVLLDLLGAQAPIFHDYFSETTKLYARMQRIETKLDSLNLFEAHTRNYFSGSTSNAQIQDDHIPFLRKGVNVLHLIPSPFPSVWHKYTDNEANLHYPTIMNLQKIMQVFVAEYMHLNV